LNRKNVLFILSEAEKVDSEYTLFGADEHRYKLQPPLEIMHISKPFCPHNASHDEILKSEITEYYKQNVKSIFCYYDDEDHKYANGFLVLGHLGCGTYYIMPVQGEHNGKIFISNLEDGYYYLLEGSFMQFYNKWLLGIKDALKKESLEQKRDAFRNVYI